MDKKILAALIVAGVAAAAGATLASANGIGFGNSEQKEAVRQAIENKDYNAWREAIKNRPKITDKINKENFDRFSDMHGLMKEGKHEEAKQIRKELGLPKFGGRHGRMDPEKREAIGQAMENCDYKAWKEQVGNHPVSKKITEENFPKFVEMHNLMKSGDKEGAKAIADELGLKKGGFKHKHKVQ